MSSVRQCTSCLCFCRFLFSQLRKFLSPTNLGSGAST
jgi:hypothetical protein